MADAYRGEDQVVTLQRIGGGAAVTISGEGNGMATIDLARTKEPRVIPGGGTNVRRQAGGLFDGSVTFTIDFNDVTRPLIWGYEGTKFELKQYPRGNASGREVRTIQFFMGYTLPAPSDDVLIFTVTGEADGGVTYATVT